MTPYLPSQFGEKLGGTRGRCGVTYFPAFLDLRGKRAVVVGGGPVAERRATALLECGAQVTWISPTGTPKLRRLARRRQLAWKRRPYRAGDLEGVFLACAATDDARAHARLRREGFRRGVLLNLADQPHQCDFIVPAQIRRGSLTLAISTQGRAPALAAWLRRKLEGLLDHEPEQVLAQVAALRDRLRAGGKSYEVKKRAQVRFLNRRGPERRTRAGKESR